MPKQLNIYVFLKKISGRAKKTGRDSGGPAPVRESGPARHRHASGLIDPGYGPSPAAKRLGHRKTETELNTHGHLWPDKKAEMARHSERL